MHGLVPRDLPDAVPIGQLEDALNPGRRRYFETTAHSGEGVMETLDYLSSEVLSRFQQAHQEQATQRETAANAPQDASRQSSQAGAASW